MNDTQQLEPDSAEETIRLLHEELAQTNHEVAALTLELELRVDALNEEIAERNKAESESAAQLQRLNLLHQITRAIGERQDLRSIFQVVIRSLEDSLPIDFGCICLHEPSQQALTIASVGARGGEITDYLKTERHSLIEIAQNGLSRCLEGNLLYEPEVDRILLPFPQQLASAGMHSLVLAPLRAENNVFGVLVAARRPVNGFSSKDCEFLRQLSEHVALAAHQTQLYEALQRAYDDLRQTQQAIMQQERLRALGQMASGVAHDINNAISPVMLYVESLLERDPTLGEDARRSLTIIQRAVEDVAATVARMREFYRPRELQQIPARVEINKLVDQAVNLTRARWNDLPQRRGIVINLHTHLAENLPSIMGIESEIRDALTNLIFNAVDAMPDGGGLTLRTRALRAIEDPLNESAVHQVHVEVADTGIGMDEKTKRHCLEPFFTTKGERGTGLGLAMVYGMAQRHQAEIEIDSKPAAGTTLRLVFPAAAVQTQATLRVVYEQSQRPVRILIVDDDPLLTGTLQSVLQADHHIVTVADGGQNGIDSFMHAQGGSAPFALVITDLGMPHIDGRKVASAIKTASPTTPVILLTGWGNQFLEDNESRSQFDRILSKPPRLTDLRACIAELTAS